MACCQPTVSGCWRPASPSSDLVEVAHADPRRHFSTVDAIGQPLMPAVASLYVDVNNPRIAARPGTCGWEDEDRKRLGNPEWARVLRGRTTRVMDAPGPEPSLRDFKATAFAKQHVRTGYRSSSSGHHNGSPPKHRACLLPVIASDGSAAHKSAQALWRHSQPIDVDLTVVLAERRRRADRERRCARQLDR